jgi:hypothetical protein
MEEVETKKKKRDPVKLEFTVRESCRLQYTVGIHQSTPEQRVALLRAALGGVWDTCAMFDLSLFKLLTERERGMWLKELTAMAEVDGK